LVKNLRWRALVLTAGLGLRLRPLTLFLPKALLPVCGVPVAGQTLCSLSEAGCEAVALNLHHQASAIPKVLGDRFQNLPITYSLEPALLGTFGALFPLKSFLSDADLIVLVNGDSLCSWPFQRMMKQHLDTGADATLLLHRKSPTAAQGGPVGVGANGNVVQLRDSPPIQEVSKRHLFMGAHILSPHLFDRLREKPGDIVTELYIPLLREGGRMHGVVTSRKWHDLGTPARYLTACLDWTRSRIGGVPGLQPRKLIADSARVDDSADIHRSVIESDAVVDADTRIEDSLLMPGAKVPQGCTAKHSIIGPNVALPAGTDIERRMVTTIQTGYQPDAPDSVMGGLVYTRID